MNKTTINELKACLHGEWDNPQFTIGFLDNPGANTDGIVCFFNKQTRQDFGYNYRLEIREGFPYLYLLTKGEGLKRMSIVFINDFETVSGNQLCLVFDLGSELNFDKINC